MKFLNKISHLLFILIFASCIIPAKKAAINIAPPEELYGQLFYDIQENENIFADSKTFVDCVPLQDVEIIKAKYAKLQDKSSESIKRFVEDNFKIPVPQRNFIADTSQINEHIAKLWDKLKNPADHIESGTLIPLPNQYIVPGGRFREIYYWDSYFTMLGLQTDKEYQIIQNMIDNFSLLIDQYGFIPNGNRTYYLSRSQPPFYSLMIKLLAEIKSDSVYSNYLPFLEKEYMFWMDGTQFLEGKETIAYRRIVKMPNGEILNRYWDDKNTPRPESFLEDKNTAQKAKEINESINSEKLYRNIRAAAESGWDFSSRWLTADKNGNYQLSSIHTTDIIPVDLNALIYHLEYLLSDIYKSSGNAKKAELFKKRYLDRKETIMKYCWDKEKSFFMDFDYIKSKTTNVYSLAAIYPLYFEMATNEQAQLVTEKIADSFLKPGGVMTTLNETGQQWDAPNGWAPLQWLTIKGLRAYHQIKLADEIKKRWLKLNRDVYVKNFKMMEKYNVVDLSKKGGGGEYPSQDGFGWTNGVFQELSKEKNNIYENHNLLKNKN